MICVMKCAQRFSLMFVFILVLAGSVHARSNDNRARFKKFRWSETKQGFHVTAILQKGFSREIEESINAGIPTTFHFYLRLKRMRWFWDNKIVSSAEFFHTVTYDTLRKVFKIVKTQAGKKEPLSVTTTDDPAKMRMEMDSFQGDLIYPHHKLKPNHKYYISIRATLRTGKLPPPWDVILFFISHDFDTKTQRQFLPPVK